MSFKKRCEKLAETSVEVINIKYEEFCKHHLIIKKFGTKTITGIGEIFKKKVNGNPELTWQMKEELKALRE